MRRRRRGVRKVEFTKDNVRVAAENAAARPGILDLLWECMQALGKADTGQAYFPTSGYSFTAMDVVHVCRRRYFVYLLLEKIFMAFDLEMQVFHGPEWACGKAVWQGVPSVDVEEEILWENLYEDAYNAPVVDFEIYEAFGSKVDILDMCEDNIYDSKCASDEGLELINGFLEKIPDGEKAIKAGVPERINDFEALCGALVFERNPVMIRFLKIPAPAGRDSMWKRIRSTASCHKAGLTWDNEVSLIGDEEFLLVSHCYYDEEGFFPNVGYAYIDAEGIFGRFAMLVVVCMAERGLL